MDQIRGQFGIVGMEDDGEAEYQVFTDKFKPKKTTDDCYTPEKVYAAVLDWVEAEYGIDRDKVVRPFWPGGNYQAFPYPDGCTVVDNPPFSILTQIQRFYQKREISFFLFAPSLTVITQDVGVTAVCTKCAIRYENGAIVNTSFRTNLSPGVAVRTAPELWRAIDQANRDSLPPGPNLPKYVYPDHVLTVALMQRLAHRRIPFALDWDQCRFVRRLDSQAADGKVIFGGGFILSDAAAADAAAADAAAADAADATVWELSEREQAIIDKLNGG